MTRRLRRSMRGKGNDQWNRWRREKVFVDESYFRWRFWPSFFDLVIEGCLDRCCLRKRYAMSLFLKLMVGGWGTAFAMFGFLALKESGKLLEIHKPIGLWLETLTPPVRVPDESLQTDNQDAA